MQPRAPSFERILLEGWETIKVRRGKRSRTVTTPAANLRHRLSEANSLFAGG